MIKSLKENFNQEYSLTLTHTYSCIYACKYKYMYICRYKYVCLYTYITQLCFHTIINLATPRKNSWLHFHPYVHTTIIFLFFAGNEGIIYSLQN